MVRVFARRFSNGQVTQLTALWLTSRPCPETLGGPCDLAGAAGERLTQALGDSGELEVFAVLAGGLLIS